ncbi:MAG: hypothetical protein MUC87_22040 [Bacteroidia bacterium]|jgi:hypothetical protein|nr:hypothetical protein [Bacteroidia bacterium]
MSLLRVLEVLSNIAINVGLLLVIVGLFLGLHDMWNFGLRLLGVGIAGRIILRLISG